MKVLEKVDIPNLEKGMEIEILEDLTSATEKEYVRIPKGLRTVVVEVTNSSNGGGVKVVFAAPGSKLHNQWISRYDFHKLKILPAITISFYVRCRGEIIPVIVNLRTAMVKDLKQIVFEKTGVPVKDQRLILKNKEFYDSNMLRDYNLNVNDIIEVQLRLKDYYLNH